MKKEKWTIAKIHQEFAIAMRGLPKGEFAIDGAYPHGRNRKLSLYNKKTGETIAIIDIRIREVKKS